jgi:hypothetical protein
MVPVAKTYAKQWIRRKQGVNSSTDLVRGMEFCQRNAAHFCWNVHGGGNLQNCSPRDTWKAMIGMRRQENTIVNHKEIRCIRFRNVSLYIQHDRVGTAS